MPSLIGYKETGLMQACQRLVLYKGTRHPNRSPLTPSLHPVILHSTGRPKHRGRRDLYGRKNCHPPLPPPHMPGSPPRSPPGNQRNDRPCQVINILPRHHPQYQGHERKVPNMQQQRTLSTPHAINHPNPVGVPLPAHLCRLLPP